MASAITKHWMHIEKFCKIKKVCYRKHSWFYKLLCSSLYAFLASHFEKRFAKTALEKLIIYCNFPKYILCVQFFFDIYAFCLFLTSWFLFFCFLFFCAIYGQVVFIQIGWPQYFANDLMLTGANTYLVDRGTFRHTSTPHGNNLAHICSYRFFHP